MQASETEFSARTHVSIRIFAPNLSPEDITQSLGVTPDHMHHQGDYPRNKPKYSAYKHSMWSLNSKVSEDEPLEVHLDNLLSILEPSKEFITSLAQHATIDFYCVLYSQSGVQLSSQIMKRTAELSITFGVVLYTE
jgi:hypothetical protein